MAHYEKRLEGETIYQGKVFRVERDKVELENGNTSIREIVRHNGGACIAALSDEDEVYMVRQFRYAFGKELWELPAGKLEPGEDPFEAAKRELAEEAGLTARHYTDLGVFYPTVGYCTEIIYTWAATGLEPVPQHLDEDEFLTVYKIPLQKALEMVYSGEIQDGKTALGILKLADLRRQGKL
ncbi:MAG TPA: NUDIX hydrolase [Candidatus Anaerofilum excrementigallinarum]|nr:NUDIX hydrolase [Candidatus Anaerofilum excrementigallinarum]